MIYSLNNAGHNASEIDLHGLYVQEAIQQTEQAIQRAQQAGLPQLIVITGKGLHSTAHVAKIKPGPSRLPLLGARSDERSDRGPDEQVQSLSARRSAQSGSPDRQPARRRPDERLARHGLRRPARSTGAAGLVRHHVSCPLFMQYHHVHDAYSVQLRPAHGQEGGSADRRARTSARTSGRAALSTRQA